MQKAEASRLSAGMTAEAEPKAELLTVPAGGSPPGRASLRSVCGRQGRRRRSCFRDLTVPTVPRRRRRPARQGKR